MERLVYFLGNKMAVGLQWWQHLLEVVLPRKISYRIFFVLGCFLIVLLLGSISSVSFGLQFLVLIPLMWLLLVLVAAYYQAKRIRQKERHPFAMVTLSKEKLQLDLLGFDETSQHNFKLLLNGKEVDSPINYTMTNRSMDSSNHRILFFLFDELIKGGIQSLTTEEKKTFFFFLRTSFLMNGQPIKSNTLQTSYSAWKYSLDKKRALEQRFFVQKVLGTYPS